MTNGEKKSQLRKYYLDKIPYQFRTEYNLQLMTRYIDALINSTAIFDNFLDILNIDKMEGKNLDFIGENLIGINRNSTPFLDITNNTIIEFTDIEFEELLFYEGEPQVQTVLNDVDYRIILKFALIVKTVYPSIGNLNTAFNNLAINGVSVFSNKSLTLSYTFNLGVISKTLIQNLKSKNLIPAPAGVSIQIWALPENKKFFNFPVFYDNNLPVYRPLEQGFNGLLYHPDYVI